MDFKYKPAGICSKEIDFTLENGKVKNVSFVGGCIGNHKGISALVEDMDADEVIVHSSGTFAVGVESVDGIPVGGKAPELLKKLQDALTAEFLAATQPD